MNIYGLDEMDRAILECLTQNARLTFSEIGEKVGISRVAVKNHIENLEKSGIIKGYKAVIDIENKEAGKQFFIDVLAIPDKYNMVLDYFASCECITKIYATTGENRIHMEGYVSNQTKYEAFVQNLRRHIDGIKSLYIADVLCTYLNKEKSIEYERAENKVQ